MVMVNDTLPPAVLRYSRATGLYFVGVRMGRKVAPLYSFDSREEAAAFVRQFNSAFRKETDAAVSAGHTVKGHG